MDCLNCYERRWYLTASVKHAVVVSVGVVVISNGGSRDRCWQGNVATVMFAGVKVSSHYTST